MASSYNNYLFILLCTQLIGSSEEAGKRNPFNHASPDKPKAKTITFRPSSHTSPDKLKAEGININLNH